MSTWWGPPKTGVAIEATGRDFPRFIVWKDGQVHSQCQSFNGATDCRRVAKEGYVRRQDPQGLPES